jgi:hypothetical protein
VILLAPEDGFNDDLLWTSMDWMVLAERLPNSPEETPPCMAPSEYSIE